MGKCGANQDRTDDLFNAIEALYQLSYDPKNERGELNLLLKNQSTPIFAEKPRAEAF